MKKKNLIILLLIPFVIALLSIVTINMTFSQFNSDISSIEWGYKDIEAFKITDGRYKLEAEGITTSSNPLAPGNNLVWTVENKNSEITEPLAEIVEDGGYFFLVPLAEGEVIVTCSNEKGTVFKKMTAVLYKNGVIIVQPTVLSSGSNIDKTVYYGEYDYDLKTETKVPMNIDLELTCYPEDLIESIEFITTDNIILNQDNLDLDIQLSDFDDSTTASLTVRSTIYDNIAPATFSFEIVKDGVNVYDYQTLLACTNKSNRGEIVVLRKSFESIQNFKLTSANNVEIFGNSDDVNYNFKKDIYSFESTYNTEYIKQWNTFAYQNKNYSTVSTKLYAGLRIQKDFYGNGYTINFDNLAFPSQTITVNGISKPELTKDDLYRGPLPFYSLGDPNGLPIFTAFGQDNVGMLIDADNVTVNDVNVKNCNSPDSISFFETVGTVVEINADNVTLKNSKISNGKNVLRSFSSMNFTLKNSLVTTSMNFLITTGSNEYIKVNERQSHSFTNFQGTQVKTSVDDYLSTKVNNRGNDVLNNYLRGTYSDIDSMRNSLHEIQNALNYGALTTIKGSMTIDDVYFENSGIAAICVESLFNGPFLYNASPTEITDKFATADGMVGKTLVPYTPTNVSGISYPVTVDITGDTKFYDYKVANDIDLEGLISENVTDIIATMGLDFDFSVDIIFPLKTLLVQKAKKQQCVYTHEGKEYVNCPVAFYGGGINLSTVTYNGEVYADRLSNMDIDLLENYLTYQSASSTGEQYINIMLKSVTVVVGFEPFEFICVKNDGYLFGEAPNLNDLVNNAKGELK